MGLKLDMALGDLHGAVMTRSVGLLGEEGRRSIVVAGQISSTRVRGPCGATDPPEKVVRRK